MNIVKQANACVCLNAHAGPVTNKPNPDGSRGRSDTTTTTPVSRGTKLDAKNERDLLGDSNSNTLGQSPGCSLGAAELVIIVGITCIATASLSTLLTITIGCFCLKRRQQHKMSQNKQTAVPSWADDNRPCWQEEGSLNSTIVSGADVGACVGTAGAAPDSNSTKGEQNMPGESD